MLGDFDVETLKGHDAARMVGEQTDAPEFEVGENLCPDSYVALGGALILGQGGQSAIFMELQSGLACKWLDGEAERGLVQVDDRATALFCDAFQ